MIMTHAPTRVTLERLLAVGGLTIVLLEILSFGFAPLHVLLLSLGTFMIYLGTWRLTAGLVSQRSNMVLRAEIQRYLALVRQLYAGRSRGDSAAIHEAKAKLRESTERIIDAAASVKDDI